MPKQIQKMLVRLTQGGDPSDIKQHVHVKWRLIVLGALFCQTTLAPAAVSFAQEADAESRQEAGRYGFDCTASTAEALHECGAYELAVAEGRAEDTVSGLVAAAKSALFLAAYQLEDEEEAEALLEAARADAQEAIRRDPEHRDANLQLAIADGYIARINTSPGRAKEARKRGEALLGRAPDDALALGFLGGWHGEAIAAYGKAIARIGIGARTRDFTAYFDAAVDAAPESPLIKAYYARLLLDINDNGMREKAKALLDDIESIVPSDAFNAFMKDNALKLKALLTADDRKALKQEIKAQRALRNLK